LNPSDAIDRACSKAIRRLYAVLLEDFAAAPDNGAAALERFTKGVEEALKVRNMAVASLCAP
jgi:hypothetical protein